MHDYVKKEVYDMIKETTLATVDELITRYPALSVCREDLVAAVRLLCDGYHGGHKLIVCCNGGSA